MVKCGFVWFILAQRGLRDCFYCSVHQYLRVERFNDFSVKIMVSVSRTLIKNLQKIRQPYGIFTAIQGTMI